MTKNGTNADNASDIILLHRGDFDAIRQVIANGVGEGHNSTSIAESVIDLLKKSTVLPGPDCAQTGADVDPVPLMMAFSGWGMGTPERVREKALGIAVAHAMPGRTMDEIISDAEKAEAYLRWPECRPAVAMAA